MIDSAFTNTIAFLFLLSLTCPGAASARLQVHIEVASETVLQQGLADYISISGGASGTFGYSISCPPIHLPHDRLQVALSDYEARNRAGMVMLLKGPFGSDEPVLRIVGENPQLPWSERVKNALRPIFGKAPVTPLGWFGHEVALADVSGNTSPELLIGARMINKGRGAAYFIPGEVLDKLVADRVAEIAIDTLIREGRATKIVDTSPEAFEFGWAVALVPRTMNSTGAIAIRRSSGPKGEVNAGGLAVISPPEKGGLMEIVGNEIMIFGEQTSVDFGRALVNWMRFSKDPSALLVVGSYANYIYDKALPTDGLVWIVRRDGASLKKEEVYRFNPLTEDGIPRHLMPALLRLGGRTIVAIEANPSMSNAPAWIDIVDMESKKSIRMSSPKLFGVEFTWSMMAIDANKDGFDDLIAAAPAYKVGKRNSGIGALVLINGRDIEAALDAGGFVNSNLISISAIDGDGLGSKRRQCTYLSRSGDAVGIFGQYGRGNAIVVPNLGRYLPK